MNSLPTSHLFLLLLGLQVPQALGMPSSHPEIKEIIFTLHRATSPSQPLQESLNTSDKYTLRHEDLLKLNLEVFMKAAENFSETGLKIKKNLEVFWPRLPNSTSLENPIVVEDNWNDFKSKLNYYLDSLLNFLNKPTNNTKP